jgi:hypothetical protein
MFQLKKEWAFAELSWTKEKMSGLLECNSTIQVNHNNLHTVTKEEIGELNAKLTCLEIQNKALRQKLTKVKETSKQKDNWIRTLQELKSKEGAIKPVSVPVSASSALRKQLADNKAIRESIVSGIVNVLFGRKKVTYVTSNDFLQQLPSIYQSFQKT